jgi:hypothetical protein
MDGKRKEERNRWKTTVDRVGVWIFFGQRDVGLRRRDKHLGGDGQRRRSGGRDGADLTPFDDTTRHDYTQRCDGRNVCAVNVGGWNRQCDGTTWMGRTRERRTRKPNGGLSLSPCCVGDVLGDGDPSRFAA